jgi:Bacteriophage Sf6, terminase small subunit-like
MESAKVAAKKTASPKKAKPKKTTSKTMKCEISTPKKTSKPYATEQERHENKRENFGRPTDYNAEICEEICVAVSCTSLGLARLCQANPHWPDRDTIYRWRWRYPDFSDQFAEAKRKQADFLVEELLDISDDGRNDWMEAQGYDGSSGWKYNGEHVNRSRLRIDTRKWIASKVLPKVYGTSNDDQVAAAQSLAEQVLKMVSEKNKK